MSKRRNLPTSRPPKPGDMEAWIQFISQHPTTAETVKHMEDVFESVLGKVTAWNAAVLTYYAIGRAVQQHVMDASFMSTPVSWEVLQALGNELSAAASQLEFTDHDLFEAQHAITAQYLDAFKLTRDAIKSEDIELLKSGMVNLPSYQELQAIGWKAYEDHRPGRRVDEYNRALDAIIKGKAIELNQAHPEFSSRQIADKIMTLWGAAGTKLAEGEMLAYKRLSEDFKNGGSRSAHVRKLLKP